VERKTTELAPSWARQVFGRTGARMLVTVPVRVAVWLLGLLLLYQYTGFVLREVAFSGWAVHARIVVDAPASDVLARINPTVGVVETVDEQHCVLVTGGDSLEIIAVWIGMLGLDFHVSEPPGLVDHVQSLAERYRRALPSRNGSLDPARRRRVTRDQPDR